jgi:hypothetical protein
VAPPVKSPLWPRRRCPSAPALSGSSAG